PDLVKKKRTGDKDADNQADLELDIKGIGGIEIDQVRIEAVIFQRLLDGRFHFPDNLIHLVPSRRDADSYRSQRAQDPSRQLLQVLQQAHRAHLPFFLVLLWLSFGSSN